MKLCSALFARLGFFSQKTDAPDAFEQRLSRIGTRERRCVVQKAVLFRNPPSLLEA